LAMTLPTKVCTSDFFSCGDNWHHSIVFSSMGHNDELKIHHLYLFLTEMHFFLTVLQMFCTSFLWFFCVTWSAFSAPTVH
jgi:hypothetical protein